MLGVTKLTLKHLDAIIHSRVCTKVKSHSRLNYQSLFGKMSPHSSPSLPWTQEGDEFPRRLCDSLPPVILFYHVCLQRTSGNIKQQSQGVGGHRVYVGIRHPNKSGFNEQSSDLLQSSDFLTVFVSDWFWSTHTLFTALWQERIKVKKEGLGLIPKIIPLHLFLDLVWLGKSQESPETAHLVTRVLLTWTAQAA